MTEAWFDDLSDEDSKFYEESVERIKKGVEQGMGFEQAASLVEFKRPEMKSSVLDDALKVILAEKHFVGQASIDDLAKTLRLPQARLMKARKEMIEAVTQAAIEKYKSEMGGPSGSA